MKNITYILGAGASCQVMPLVKDMKEGLDSFWKFLSNDRFSILREAIREPLQGVVGHTTIDTYAKKLYLKNEHTKLRKLKLMAASYFQYEQHRVTGEFESIRKGKKGLVDPRYDVFMATHLIRSGDFLELPGHIKVISWNYDSQIEIAFSHFGDCSPNEAKRRLYIWPPNHLSFRNYENSNDTYKIIKLNGSADQLINNNDAINEIVDDDFDMFNIERLYRFLELYQSEISLHNSEWTSGMNFAWELADNRCAERGVSESENILRDSIALVVIGYSFPTFNREVDMRLLNTFNGSEIFVQSPEADFIKSKIKRLYVKCNKKAPSIYTETNTTEFLSP